VALNGQTDTLAQSFTYDANIGPVITSISPNEVSGTADNTEITITGNRFLNGNHEPSVKAGDKDCVYVSHTDTEIKCTVPVLGHGLFNIRVSVTNVGATDLQSQNSEISSVLEMTNVSPSTGSILGGTELTISGKNFGTDKNVVSVLLDNKVCDVSDVTDTVIMCSTASPAKTVELTNSGTDPGMKLIDWLILSFTLFNIGEGQK